MHTFDVRSISSDDDELSSWIVPSEHWFLLFSPVNSPLKHFDVTNDAFPLSFDAKLLRADLFIIKFSGDTFDLVWFIWNAGCIRVKFGREDSFASNFSEFPFLIDDGEQIDTLDGVGDDEGDNCSFNFDNCIWCSALLSPMTNCELVNPRQRIRQASCNNWRRACLRHFARRFWNQTCQIKTS